MPPRHPAVIGVRPLRRVDPVPQVFTTHIHKAVVKPEDRIQRSAGEDRHLSTYKDVDAAMVSLEPTPAVRRAEIVVRPVGSDKINVSVPVQESSPAAVGVGETVQSAVSIAVTVWRLGCPAGSHATGNRSTVVTEVAVSKQGRVAGSRQPAFQSGVEVGDTTG